jgi:hypothetical protein
MEIQARYYGKCKTGETLYVCSHHLARIAIKLEGPGRMAPKKGIRFIGSLSQYTQKTCCECHGDHKKMPSA